MSATFDELFAEVIGSGPRFGHRQHVQLTWLAVRHCGRSAAIELVSQGIQRTARYAGAPQKYHATISRAWVELIAHHVAGDAADEFDTFVGRNAPLFDKRLLNPVLSIDHPGGRAGTSRLGRARSRALPLVDPTVTSPTRRRTVAHRTAC
jgi:hypothetical protein